MSVKTILIALNEVSRAKQICSIAAGLAMKSDAHIVGMFVIPAVEVYPAAGMQLSAQVFEGHREFYLKHARTVKAVFNEEMQRQEVSHEWRQVDSDTSQIADAMVQHAFESDLVIVPQKQEDSVSGVETDFAERIILESGRPVLVIPTYGKFSNIGKQVLVAWNGTREAARAVFDAVPLMLDAENVTVSWLNSKETLPDEEVLAGSELATTLARHGIKATSQTFPTGDLGTGDALLSHASDVGADLLVMGAYGHSRIREYVFGGATRTVLETMTLPVLMSH